MGSRSLQLFVTIAVRPVILEETDDEEEISMNLIVKCRPTCSTRTTVINPFERIRIDKDKRLINVRPHK